MASELYVETLKGLTSGANANKVIIPSGQTLYAPGHVLQVVNASIGNVASTTSTSFTSTGLSASITPSSTSSKILVLVDGMGSSQDTNQAIFRMVRSHPSANTVVDGQIQSSFSSNAYGYTMAICEGSRIRQPISSSMYDSPATTSAITYTLLFTTTGSTAYVGRWGLDNNWNQDTTLTLMEIAG